MKLTDLVKFLVSSEKLDTLYQEKEMNVASEAFLIYMKDSLDIDSDIYIFEIEETNDDLIFEKNGANYFQLFPVDYAVDLIESDLALERKEYSDLEIAKRLLDYRIKDA